MTRLKRGQHYDSEDPELVREASRILRAIRKHLSEERCNHTLREIVEEGLKER